ncbi:methyl-accepting chemotaxis protein [Caldicellulosiruptor naganoensis]|uniref:histidine kinase n=1 Tax=Caldicellulosiruptor naganoensis TaxID=29324 RepID=A0ABY7BHK6_9FIRM|nr:methyl-accepting chemotaxis protein [Caldicellulosiruptor naganoensis]WAM31970.1 methyl-accepting chemotaxis protein [Caldicellulosiruptor naganoensis]
MTKSYRLIRNRVSVSLLTLFLLLLVVSVLVNYTIPQKSLKESIETGFSSDTVATAEAVDNYFGYITEMLMFLALNRDLSNVLSMPESDRNKIENVASYNLVLSVLKDAAKRLQGDLLITVSGYSLYVDKQGKVLTRKLKEESNFRKLAVIESDIPVEIYADSEKLNFRINIVNLLSSKKVGEINLCIPKSNLEKQLDQFKKKYNVVLLANNSEIVGKFNKNTAYVSKSVDTLDGNFILYLQISKSNMYKDLKIIQLLFVSVSIVSITLIVFLAFFIARIIMNPLSHLNGLFLSVREKDFTFSILESNFKDEIEYVFDSFKKIVDSLRKSLKILKDITGSGYFDKEYYTKIASKSNEVYDSIFRTSNMLVENFQYQDKLLNKILDEAKTYCTSLDHFKDSIRSQMLKLDRLKEINSKIKLEFNKSE